MQERFKRPSKICNESMRWSSDSILLRWEQRYRYQFSYMIPSFKWFIAIFTCRPGDDLKYIISITKFTSANLSLNKKHCETRKHGGQPSPIKHRTTSSLLKIFPPAAGSHLTLGDIITFLQELVVCRKKRSEVTLAKEGANKGALLSPKQKTKTTTELLPQGDRNLICMRRADGTSFEKMPRYLCIWSQQKSY